MKGMKVIKIDGLKKPCPFCGSGYIYGEEVRKGIHRIYRVECWCCGASVESVASIDKAIKWWNTRAIDREDLLKVADECECADVDGVVDWADRIRKAVSW